MGLSDKKFKFLFEGFTRLIVLRSNDKPKYIEVKTHLLPELSLIYLN